MKVWLTVVLLVLAGASGLFHVWAFSLVTPDTYSDLLPRIVGTRDALQGMNPYSAAVLRDIQTAQYGHVLAKTSHRNPQYFSYPALIVPVLAPFAHFSWSAIRTGFLWLMVPAFVAACLLWLRLIRPGASVLTLVMVAGLALFAWPTLWGFDLQQPTMVLFVLLAVVAFSLRRRWDWVAEASMALALIKPQFGLPLMLWLLIWSVRHRRWQFPASFAICFAGLWMLADWMVPSWFVKWIESLGAYTAIVGPICELAFGKEGGLAVTAILGVWCIWLLWGMLDFDADTVGFGRAVALAMTASVFVTPTRPALIYNQVLLIPAILLVVFSQPSRPVSFVARLPTIGLVAWSYLAVVISATIEIFDPRSRIGYLWPFLDQFLVLAVLVSFVANAEDSEWSKCGLRRFFQWMKPTIAKA